MKFNMRLSYKELQIVKHALQHYVNRPNSTDKEVEEENRVLAKFINKVDEVKEEYNIGKHSEKLASDIRMKFGKFKGHYEWDLAVEWFQMSNDYFFEKYGFNFVPKGKLFEQAKEYVYRNGNKGIQQNVNIEIKQPDLSRDVLKEISRSLLKGDLMRRSY